MPTTGTTTAAPVVFNLRYPGQYFDSESGLHYNVNRSYDPRTGRYTQGDPLGLYNDLNRFGYPLSSSDPYGLWSITFGAYTGPDGQITFGSANGNGFATVRVGLGLGGGFSYNPAAGLPGEAPNDPSRGGVVAACKGEHLGEGH